ncbi:MAG: GDP-mannose 4,6-dehydratase [Nanoarchaeota archaeon]|nr:GDP-mannose 4,6-dehydratase [Nanoarchaeota archaeon]
MKRCLITGVTGFAGSHLAELLLSKGYNVYGTSRWRSDTKNIDAIKDKIKLIDADLRDSYSMQNAVNQAEPDYIFHLAAQSFVLTSWHAPQETLVTNISGNLNVLEAVRNSKFNPVIHIAGSSEEYGMVYPTEVPIKETNPLRPLSPYAVSKVGQEMLSSQYNRSYGIKTVVTRAFNHSGPRRGEVFATSTFAKQIAQIEKGKKEPVIMHGNLDAKRDFTDVRDMVRAYLLAVEKCKPGEVYNICSGDEGIYSIKQVMDILLGFSNVKVETRQDPKRMRPSDVSILHGDSTKFRDVTGWKPEYKFEQTMKDLLDYWRERV